ncbi:uncharacterized protein BDR25DRAFT_362866 [Lindgomyces ingoldianus]|uniref:Uncharacterized protein n=1 Tax=Lindgomyces ingoldianus TaxID=673940 RepID=A0ACB6Q9V5_9PLEO|nr:uncharacterized protein BDR25DRAFT_362866 [Lindgomyces ingoldianus]KAF2463315.1 hypothetical protein BDR25DRAFT_362866 [Lindgomyces ingoldianus]
MKTSIRFMRDGACGVGGPGDKDDYERAFFKSMSVLYCLRSREGESRVNHINPVQFNQEESKISPANKSTNIPLPSNLILMGNFGAILDCSKSAYSINVYTVSIPANIMPSERFSGGIEHYSYTVYWESTELTLLQAASSSGAPKTSLPLAVSETAVAGIGAGASVASSPSRALRLERLRANVHIGVGVGVGVGVLVLLVCFRGFWDWGRKQQQIKYLDSKASMKEMKVFDMGRGEVDFPMELSIEITLPELLAGMPVNGSSGVKEDRKFNRKKYNLQVNIEEGVRDNLKRDKQRFPSHKCENRRLGGFISAAEIDILENLEPLIIDLGRGGKKQDRLCRGKGSCFLKKIQLWGNVDDDIRAPG